MPVNRSFDVKGIEEAVNDYCFFDILSWVSDLRNIALEEDGNFALFEYEKPGIYTGHYFFTSAKGRQALRLSKRILEKLFSNEYNVEVVRGLTPLENLKARWMSRQVGFKSYGAINTVLGPCELFILTRAEFLCDLKDEWQNG